MRLLNFPRGIVGGEQSFNSLFNRSSSIKDSLDRYFMAP